MQLWWKTSKQWRHLQRKCLERDITETHFYLRMFLSQNLCLQSGQLEPEIGTLKSEWKRPPGDLYPMGDVFLAVKAKVVEFASRTSRRSRFLLPFSLGLLLPILFLWYSFLRPIAKRRRKKEKNALWKRCFFNVRVSAGVVGNSCSSECSESAAKDFVEAVSMLVFYCWSGTL